MIITPRIPRGWAQVKTGFKRPTDMYLSGDGRWRQYKGSACADLIGTKIYGSNTVIRKLPSTRHFRVSYPPASRRALIKRFREVQAEVTEASCSFVCCALNEDQSELGWSARRFFERVFSPEPEPEEFYVPACFGPDLPRQAIFSARIIAIELAVLLLEDGFTEDDFSCRA